MTRRPIHWLSGLPVLTPEEIEERRHQGELKRLDETIEMLQYQRDELVEDPSLVLDKSADMWMTLLRSTIVPEIPAMQNQHVILQSLYPELTPKEVNLISMKVTNKLKPYMDDVKQVELYNQQFVTQGANQKFLSVEAFNRTIHIRVTLR
jgi:hypothetical protein